MLAKGLTATAGRSLPANLSYTGHHAAGRGGASTSRLGSFEVYLIVDFGAGGGGSSGGGGGGGDGGVEAMSLAGGHDAGSELQAEEADDGPLSVAAASIPTYSGIHSKLWTRYFPSSQQVGSPAPPPPLALLLTHLPSPSSYPPLPLLR